MCVSARHARTCAHRFLEFAWATACAFRKPRRACERGKREKKEKRIKRFREKREKRFPSHFAECHGQKCRAFTKREMRRREGRHDGSLAFQNPLTPLNAAVAREKKQALYVCMYICVKNTEEIPTYEQWDLKEIVL